MRLTKHRCPCYCGGEGFLVLVACPRCGTVVGRCDEVEEMIRDVVNPDFDAEESICHSDVPCPFCNQSEYGEFRAATTKELRRLGLSRSDYTRWP